ncbi:MAG: hypothetical protein OXG81_05280, partial [Acidobacteria bacterium]|nr:hypothetical protein [Acidobacteriota bacterium]
MERLAFNYFTKGLADSTRRTYSSAQNGYLMFCRDAALQPLPASESTLCYFVATLARDNLKHSSIKAYLSAVRFLHIAEGFSDPFLPSLQRLQYTLRGIKRCEAEKGDNKKERLPVDPTILRLVRRVWDEKSSDPDNQMLWAACCIGFFGFLRAGEFTVPSDSSFDPEAHLCYSDIAVDNSARPQVIRITIKQSKTDPFRKRVDLFLGRTSVYRCGVHRDLHAACAAYGNCG